MVHVSFLSFLIFLFLFLLLRSQYPPTHRCHLLLYRMVSTIGVQFPHHHLVVVVLLVPMTLQECSCFVAMLDFVVRFVTLLRKEIYCVPEAYLVLMDGKLCSDFL